ncbi:OLC1v1020636C1 [Oldenlandia corymbosa var. corymbosa]|uniref:OLC1v1020636C1 n=1 Tax=Oldenlandia corymbosa var. corymbosa TaxID=529605 RepID=A0AAV1EH30_OLDCO|nr:OLC1v1020636C1 [Oldenlandia corymbosa var. corymbosa]
MGAQEKSPSSNNSMQRVKVYRLSDDGKWDDQGTGHVSVDYLERTEELGLFVIDEEDNETLLLHRISSDDIYRKQDDTIISWRDPEYATELALSFQETCGCNYIWDSICNVQRNLHFNTLSSDTYHNVNSELRELPPVELSTLPLILKIVVESGISDQLRVTDLILHDPDFIRKLLDLFRICEDLENIDGLHMIYKIVRGIILLNSTPIFEKLFGDDHIMDIIGSLEYDPDGPHINHRKFLKEHVVFKEAMTIKDPLVLSKIHQTYRVGYLKDVVLPRVVDDATAASLTAIIHSNNAIVVSLLKDDSTFIQELFARLRSTTSAESKKDLVLFLHEFCTLSKSLQMVQQLRLYRDLVNEGILDIIADILQSEDKKLVLTGTDILILLLNQDPNLLRSYVTRQEGIPLFGLLVKGMLTDFGDDMHCQFLEILRNLLDSYASGSQRESIVDIFYERHLGQLVDAITSSCPGHSTSPTVSKFGKSDGESGNQSSVRPEILLNICDLLCFCVLHHPYRIKCNFLLNNVIDKVLLLTRRREKYLVVAAVRFIRTLISRNDEHLVNHIVKNDLLRPVVLAFVDNGSRYNLLNSAVLELFEYIRKENLKILLKYLIESYWEQLVKFDFLPSICSLKVKYEQSLESGGLRSSVNVSDPRKRIDERALEKEEEDYFNEDSDEEDSASASVPRTNKGHSRSTLPNGSASASASASASDYPSIRSGGLVDYDDDDDDDEFNPPPREHLDKSAEDDEEIAESFRLKRKLASKEEPEPKKLRRLPKPSKPNEGVFAALCSTLSQAILPGKKTSSITADVPRKNSNTVNQTEANQKEVGPVSSSNREGSSSSIDVEGNNARKEVSPGQKIKDKESNLHDLPENIQEHESDENPLIHKASPEMAVNGS